MKKFGKITGFMLCLAVTAAMVGCNTSGVNSNTDSSSSSGAESDNNTSDTSANTESTTSGENTAEISGNLEEVALQNGDLIAEITVEGYGTIKAKLFPEAAPLGVENFQKLCDSGFYKGLNIHRVISDFMIQGGSLNGDGTGGDAAVNGGSFGIETNRNMRHFYGALCYANAGGTNTTQFYIVNSKTPAADSDFDGSVYDNYIQQYKDAAEQYAEAGQQTYADFFNSQAEYYETTQNWLSTTPEEVKELYKQRGGTPFLDGNYTVFGQVYEGFDVLDSISAVETKDNGNDEQSKPVKDIIISDITVSTYNE